MTTPLSSHPSPSSLPPKGFYQHYKHDPNGPENNYTYEVIGIGRNTEEGTLTVLYRPLYDSAWMPPADYQSRPLEMFIGMVVRDGKTMPRFERITDSALAAKLETVRTEKFGK
ncbi:MAG: DUF1653 domain-containing protein [Proteobacteria bacterium]|nr:DUF1653 domain-containing protein [Pseudomonadota bacterium]